MLTTELAALRADMFRAGWTAESPATLDTDAARMAREDRRSEQ